MVFEFLFTAHEKGMVVFTVDYALEDENIAWVYQSARQYGFIPLVSSRGLDTLVEPYLGE